MYKLEQRMQDMRSREIASEQDLRDTIEVVNESMPSSAYMPVKTQKKRFDSEKSKKHGISRSSVKSVKDDPSIPDWV